MTGLRGADAAAEWAGLSRGVRALDARGYAFGRELDE